jgi:hypothetical protein
MIDDDKTKTTSATATEWHGATAEEHRAAVSHALKLRPWEKRPGKADEMTPGETLFYVVSPHSDEPFLRGVLSMVVQELWAMYEEQDDKAAAYGVLDTIGMIARRLEVAVELDQRFEKEARRGR